MSSVVISGDTSGTVTLAAPAVAGSNTATLPVATGELSMLGTTGQTWQAFTSGNRVSGTTYYNTTGKPIQIAISAQGTSSLVTITVGGVTACQYANGAVTSGYWNASAIVPTSSSYSATYSPTFLSWSELR